jgi:hypothetical protein
MRNHPGGLEPERVDQVFLEEICELNRDSRFFRGIADHDMEGAHPYLTKYVILYFDHDYSMGGREEELIDFVRRRQHRMRPKPASPVMSTEEACRVLGISPEECRTMDRKDLARLYREEAKKAHPDSGGDHDAFVRMREAYESLCMRK